MKKSSEVNAAEDFLQKKSHFFSGSSSRILSTDKEFSLTEYKHFHYEKTAVSS